MDYTVNSGKVYSLSGDEIGRLEENGTITWFMQANTPAGSARPTAAAVISDQVSGGNRLSVALDSLGLSAAAGIQAPFKYAAFGDSRTNFTGKTDATVHGQSTIHTLNRSASYVLQAMPDIEPVFCGGLSGDTTNTIVAGSGWNNPARSQGKTLAALAATLPDVVDIQYGVNNYSFATDVSTTYAAKLAQTTGDLKALVLTLLEMGAKVNLQDVIHCTQAYYTANGGDAVLKWQLGNAINAEMSAFVANVAKSRPGVVTYTPVNSLLAGSDGYADATLFADGVHANDAQARIAGAACAASIRTLLPQKPGFAYTALSGQHNMMRQYPVLATADTLLTTVSGTYSASTATVGFDTAVGRHYVDLAYNVSALASGSAQIRLDVFAHLGSYGGATPDWTIAANDWLQGGGVLVCGANVGALDFRLRAFKQAGGSDFADQGDAALVPVVSYATGAVVQLRTPRVQVLAASSGIEAAASAKGVQLQLFVRSIATGPGSVRLYSPALRKVA
jgi:lysophospholipase L1-like esterase